MTSKEFYDAQEHQLNKRLLDAVRATLAEYVATHPEADTLRYVLESEADFKVPVLYCQGYNGDDPCWQLKYHDGPCR